MIKKYSYQFEEIGDDIVVEYPDGDVFLRERNYVKIYTAHETNCTLFSVTIAGKEIRFNYDLLKPISFDVSPYYSKGATSISVTIADGSSETFTIPLSLTKHDCYSPFLEFVPERCGDAQYARIVPPNRMLWDGKKSTTSMLAAVRDDDYFSGYEYEMEDVPYATYRPSNAWLTTAQKQEHLGETYRNTLPATGNLAELDSNGNPLWIEQGDLYSGGENIGKTFEQQRASSKNACRAKTIFKNYNGLSIGTPPSGIQMLVVLYDANKTHRSIILWTTSSVTLNNASTYPYISLVFKKLDYSNITPSELVGITSSTLTNPEAGKSYRWVIDNNEYKWVELTAEQLINERFFWSINGKNDTSEVLLQPFDFGSSVNASLLLEKVLSPTGTPPSVFEVLQSVKRSVSPADSSLPYVYIRWRTPWGVSVEHLFYLGSYSSDKAGEKELESVNYYEELSQHVRVGSFYLDGITQPYDLFYYKTLENAELVEMYFPSYAFKPTTYMPNGDDYVAIKINGSDVADAVVDGVAQRVITFKFELS